jgi:hypothetical protein
LSDQSIAVGLAAVPARKRIRDAALKLPVLSPFLRQRSLRYRMQAALGYRPDLENPRTFNEKIGWRILYDRNPLLVATTDKIAVRDHVARLAGPDILIPLHGSWDRAADIAWDALPAQFVLKASHGWNMNLLVTDKAGLDTGLAAARAAGWLRHNHYDETGEWAYRDIRPRLLAEQLLLDEAGRIPADLKFYVFNGRMRLLQVHTGRHGAHHRITTFDESLRRLPLRQTHATDPDYTLPPEAPAMIPLAERLGAGFDFARVDLYCVRGRVWFGEITHYDGGGCTAFEPPSYDRLIGDLWQRPGRDGFALPVLSRLARRLLR